MRGTPVFGRRVYRHSLERDLAISIEDVRRKKLAELETMSGLVAQRNERGIKLEGREEEWLNFSQYPKGPMEEPSRGDNVKLGVSQDKNGKWWIGTCEIQHRGSQPITFGDGAVPQGGRDLSIMRQTCLKVAGEIVTAWVGRLSAEIVFDRGVISGNVLALSEDFERWVTRDDVRFE